MVLGRIIEERHRYDGTTGESFGGEVRTFPAYFDEEKGYLFWVRKGFAKSYQDVPFPEHLNMLDRGRMATLAKHIWSDTNMLGYRGRGGVRPYSVRQIGELVGCRERQAHRFLGAMVRLEMLARVEVTVGKVQETHFYVNPIYFFSSNRLPLNLYLLFRRQLDAVLPAWVRERFAEASKTGG